MTLWQSTRVFEAGLEIDSALVPVLESAVDVTSPEFAANRAAMVDRVDTLEREHALAIAGGGERYAARHRQRGRLLVRERIELLVDRDSAFLELSALAAWGTEFNVGAALVTGIGVVEGVECVITANDPTVRGGAINPIGLRKHLRALDIAKRNRLPLITLVESGGADLPTQADLFIPAGQIFRDLTQLSAMAIPTIALVFGNSTAGGAYMPGMCDYSVMVDRAAKVFLGGPPLVKMATGEESDDEELGGAAHARLRLGPVATTTPPMSSTASASAARSWPTSTGASSVRGRRIPSSSPATTPTSCSAWCRADLRVPFDPREVDRPRRRRVATSTSTRPTTAPAW